MAPELSIRQAQTPTAKNKEMTNDEALPGITVLPTGIRAVPLPPKQTVSSSEFSWWVSDDGVVAESLQFDQCCSKELADSAMDTTTEFSTFPSTEAIVERHANIDQIEANLNRILLEHKGCNGVGVFLESVSGTSLPTYTTLTDVTPVCHVFDLIVLKERLPPVIISIFKHECPKEEAKKYCLTLGRLLKRHCSKSTCMEKGSMKLFFSCKLYFLGEGYECLPAEEYYPVDYLSPSIQAIDAARYVLARILLDCKPYITDRYGNIMVKHLSSYQAKLLLGRRSKVMIVASKAGSGKTVLALEMARRIKKQYGKARKVILFCRSRGLAAFVKWQTKEMGSVDTKSVSVIQNL